ncbi:hypothetical protein AAE02nite_20560 [Adhaeribacter aerolatus]|uniref:KAP NTPase domain-containing protein n=1 Tax=Adhaeribacter aerolatus TaxID=670289 RepID=A0A512AXE0_9BACT|nr:P-loop NTPase fold protein [Adhaeribacter aerolatus]GEO04392.1 hypothetical protein AAE02nite_20560 [Adhaeribacter aerolatus]
MALKHYELEVTPGNPFSNCKLDRQKYASVLTDLIDSYSQGFVLAINNKWGTGKTTFVRMWEQELKDNNYQTVYFNAWENDFENNPLTALMGELKALTNVSNEPEFKNTLKKAAILSKHLVPIIAQAIADRYINTEGIKDAFLGVTKGIADVFEHDVNEYAKKKRSISEFRDSLSKFIANTNEEKPLIFIVDELDRCRPDYAVSILEQIKHFFSVSNIIFILSIDKTQLGNAIRGVYGSDRIDADEYLRRFIDIEYSIPEPENDLFYTYLYEYFEFDEFFNSSERKKYPELKSDKESFLRICKLLFTNAFIPLRQQEKIFALARLALRTFNINNYVVPTVYLFLIYIKIIHNNFYENLKCKQLSISQLQEEFFKIIQPNISKEVEWELMDLEVHLLNFYNNYLYPRFNGKKFYDFDGKTGEDKLLINSIVNKDAGSNFLDILKDFNKGRSNIGNLELKYYFDKIDLSVRMKF